MTNETLKPRNAVRQMIDLQAETITQNDNIYNVKRDYSFFFATISECKSALLFFDGLGWSLDPIHAKRFATLDQTSAQTEPERFGPHPIQIWRFSQVGARAVTRSQSDGSLPTSFSINELGVRPCPCI